MKRLLKAYLTTPLSFKEFDESFAFLKKRFLLDPEPAFLVNHGISLRRRDLITEDQFVQIVERALNECL